MTGTPCLTGDLRTPGKRRAAGALKNFRGLGLRAPTVPIGWFRSPNYSSRNGTTVTGVCIHTAEGPTDAMSLGDFFAQASSQVSSHVGIDDVKRVNYVDPKYEAWTLRNGNPWTENAELCGFASWTRAQWLQHPGMLQLAAEWVAERCHANGVPSVRITADDIRAGRRSGYFAHWDYTLGTGDGTHWDVGQNFPWDIFGGLVQTAYNPTPAPNPVTDKDDDMPFMLHNAKGDLYFCGPGFAEHVNEATDDLRKTLPTYEVSNDMCARVVKAIGAPAATAEALRKRPADAS